MKNSQKKSETFDFFVEIKFRGMIIHKILAGKNEKAVGIQIGNYCTQKKIPYQFTNVKTIMVGINEGFDNSKNNGDVAMITINPPQNYKKENCDFVAETPEENEEKTLREAEAIENLTVLHEKHGKKEHRGYRKPSKPTLKMGEKNKKETIDDKAIHLAIEEKDGKLLVWGKEI